MRRQSDIGWTELIIGIILIIFGLFIVRQPVGIITWIVIVCGVLAILTGIADIILYVRMERFTGFGPILSLITGILSVMAGFMLIVHPGAGTWAIGNDPSDLDHCTLCFQTFPSSVYENAFGTTYYHISMILNILGLIVGFLLVFRPMITIFSMGVLVGAYLILEGIECIVAAVNGNQYYR